MLSSASELASAAAVSDGPCRATANCSRSFPLQRKSKPDLRSLRLAGFYWPFRSPIHPGEFQRRSDRGVGVRVHALVTIAALRYGPVPETHPGDRRSQLALQAQGWRFTGSTLVRPIRSTCLTRGSSSSTVSARNCGSTQATTSARCGATATSRSAAHATAGRILGGNGQRSRSDRRQVLAVAGRRQAPLFWRSQSCLLDEPASGVLAWRTKVSVWLMYFKREPVSFCLCLDCGDIRHIVANNYAEHVRRLWHRFDPVQVRLSRCHRIRHDPPRQHRDGRSGYKSRWGAQPSFKLVDWIAFRPGVRGRLLGFAYAMRRNVRWRGSSARRRRQSAHAGRDKYRVSKVLLGSAAAHDCGAATIIARPTDPYLTARELFTDLRHRACDDRALW